MLVKNKKPSTAKISIQTRVAQYFFFCVWYAKDLLKAICTYLNACAKGLRRRNYCLHKYHAKTKLFWAKRSWINVSFSSDYPDMSSKRCMRYNVIFWKQLFIRMFNIHFSFARWYNYDVSTCIYGPPYAVSRVKSFIHFDQTILLSFISLKINFSYAGAHYFIFKYTMIFTGMTNKSRNVTVNAESHK